VKILSVIFFLGVAMNKVMSIMGLILLAFATSYAQADSRYTYEYSTNSPHNIYLRDDDDDSYRSNKSRQPVYQQQYFQQQPQIIVSPNIVLRGNQDRYLQQRDYEEHDEHEWRDRERDEKYMQKLLRDLERRPRARYYENQYYRDDTHW
jgi:hypothetical protein